MGLFKKEMPNYYALSLDELADLYDSERVRSNNLLKKKLAKTKKQVDDLKKARTVAKATANGCKEGGLIQRLISSFGKKEDAQ